MATNTSSAATAAAARRRRIAEKGAERLALITGRTPSISSSSPLPPPISDEITDSSLNKDTPTNNENAGDDVTSDEQQMLHNSEPKTETSAETSSETRDIQSFLDTLTEQNPSISTSNRSQYPRSQTRFNQTFSQTFSPKRLRPAIKASENTRTYCSVVMALLVLLSYADFPVLGSGFIKNIILFRPLILLLVSNITIVVAPLLLEEVKQIERRVSSTGDAGFGNNIGTILEWGMLMKTGSSALFMDCSIYSVVVVCGMSYMMRFGW